MGAFRKIRTAIVIALITSAFNPLGVAALTITTAVISFSGVTLNGTDQLVSGSTTAWRADASGEAGGWNVTVASTDFTNAALKTIPVANFEIRLLDSNIVHVSGDLTGPASTQTTYAPLSGSALKIASAGVGVANGVYDLTPEFRLLVPAETFAGNYAATVTISVIAGP